MDFENVKRLIEEFNEIPRDDWGDLSLYIAEQTANEAYENDKELHCMFASYRDDPHTLRIINDTLICVCGWGIETLLTHVLKEEK